jgi:hypothetical protein
MRRKTNSQAQPIAGGFFCAAHEMIDKYYLLHKIDVLRKNLEVV